MSRYEAISLMIMFSTFNLSLISLIVRLTKDNSKEKNNHPAMPCKVIKVF